MFSPKNLYRSQDLLSCKTSRIYTVSCVVGPSCAAALVRTHQGAWFILLVAADMLMVRGSIRTVTYDSPLNGHFAFSVLGHMHLTCSHRLDGTSWHTKSISLIEILCALRMASDVCLCCSIFC